jgi:cell division protein FtsB
MSDILEDQKIHLIVKDYKRMVEQHDKLVEIGKEFQQQLIAKEKELAKVKMENEKVKAELKTLKSKGTPDERLKKSIKVQLNEIWSRANGIYNRMAKDMEGINGILENIKRINETIV